MPELARNSVLAQGAALQGRGIWNQGSEVQATLGWVGLGIRLTILKVPTALSVTHTEWLMLLGHTSTMVVTLQNPSGIPTVLHVSRGEAATPIVRDVQHGVVRRRHIIAPPPKMGFRSEPVL